MSRFIELTPTHFQIYYVFGFTFLELNIVFIIVEFTEFEVTICHALLNQYVLDFLLSHHTRCFSDRKNRF